MLWKLQSQFSHFVTLPFIIVHCLQSTSSLSSPASPVRYVVPDGLSTADGQSTTESVTHVTDLCGTVPVQPDKVGVVAEVKAKTDIRKIEINV